MKHAVAIAGLVLLAACGAGPSASGPETAVSLEGTVERRDETFGTYVLADGRGSFLLAEDTAIMDTSGAARSAEGIVGSHVRVSCALGAGRCIAERVAILARLDLDRPSIIEPPQE